MNKHHYFIVQILHLVVTILTAVGVNQNHFDYDNFANATNVKDVSEIQETKEAIKNDNEVVKSNDKPYMVLGKTRKTLLTQHTIGNSNTNPFV